MPVSTRASKVSGKADERTILFDTATTHDPVKKEWIRNYIVNRAGVLQARPPESILQSPPALVHKLAECVSDIINKPEHFPEANVAVLKLSTPLEWAAELYWHTTDNCRALCARTKAPKDLAKYAVEKLSNSFTVYLAFVDDQLYPGSGTQANRKSNNGGRRRQLDRSLNRTPSDALHKAIHLAHEKGLKPAQWVQAVDIRVPKLVDGQWTFVRTDELDDVDVLLHYRVLVRLGEHCFGCLLGRNIRRRYLDHLLWPVSWKPLGPWPAFIEGIQGVMTREAKNARRRVENISAEQREKKNAGKRVENISAKQREERNAAARVENMTDKQREKRNAAQRVENKTDEQREKRNAAQRVENMTDKQREAKNARQRVENKPAEQREKENAAKRVENMTAEQREKQNAGKRVENISAEQREARNARRRVGNLTAKQREKKNAAGRVENKTAEQREAKNARRRVGNLTAEQREKKKANNRKSNANRAAKKLALAEKTRSEMNEENAAGS